VLFFFPLPLWQNRPHIVLLLPHHPPWSLGAIRYYGRQFELLFYGSLPPVLILSSPFFSRAFRCCFRAFSFFSSVTQTTEFREPESFSFIPPPPLEAFFPQPFWSTPLSVRSFSSRHPLHDCFWFPILWHSPPISLFFLH